MLSLVLRSSLQVEVLDVSGISHRSAGGAAPPLPRKPQSASLSLWGIETHVRIKVVSAANVNAGDLMKVCYLFFLFFASLIIKKHAQAALKNKLGQHNFFMIGRKAWL